MPATTLADFQIEFLGIDTPSAFAGHGTAFSRFAFSTYGAGDTEEEALEDCLEMMSQSVDFEFTDEVEQRIRAAYGKVDDIAEAWDLDCKDCEDRPQCLVGIKWNETTAGAKE
jgi:hypothetical protein